MGLKTEPVNPLRIASILVVLIPPFLQLPPNPVFLLLLLDDPCTIQTPQTPCKSNTTCSLYLPPTQTSGPLFIQTGMKLLVRSVKFINTISLTCRYTFFIWSWIWSMKYIFSLPSVWICILHFDILKVLSSYFLLEVLAPDPFYKNLACDFRIIYFPFITI